MTLPVGLDVVLRNGLPVFPCARGGKKPLTPHGCKDAATDLRQVEAWAGTHPGCNWGAAMGRGVVALDIDCKHGNDGGDALRRLVDAHGPLPPTLTNATPNRGQHRLFRVAHIVKNSASKLAPGLDVRGDGGYIVIPPSSLRAGVYEWQDPAAVIADAPEWLFIARAIPEGQRNDTLFRHGCALRARNLPQGKILDALRGRNLAECRPPLPDEELQQIVSSVMKQRTSLALTDLGNAERLIAAHGADVRFLQGLGWVDWDGHRWCADLAEQRVMRRVADVHRGIFAEAAQDPENNREIGRWAITSQAAGRLEAAERIARWQEGIAERLTDYDTQPFLVGLRNGVYDLARDEFRAGRREDRLMLATDVEYDAAARCPTWERFQLEIHAGDVELVAFKQRAWGYTLSGDTSEQVLFIAHGTGANGKTTEQNAIFDVMGDYARKIEPETLLARDRGGASNDIARLRGARFVATVEVEDGKRLAESLVKQLTGQDRMTARFLYREHFEFVPVGKLWLATNHKPEITGTNHAIWRRILLVPYAVRFDGAARDPALPTKLLAERAGILNWMIEGFRQWRGRGLDAPACVRGATKEYRVEMDRVGQFLAECCELGAAAKTKASDVYRRYEAWMKQNGTHPLSARRFHERMARDHGLQRTKDSVDFYPALSLKPWGAGDDRM